MTGPLLLAIDIGTQSVRAALVEPDGTTTRGAEAYFRIAALSRKRCQ